MKCIYLSLVVLLLSYGDAISKRYYISTTGSNSYSGLSQTNAWRTITYAASTSSPVTAGDTIYVKAGNYGQEYVNFDKSGAAGKPIVFLGYQTTPGDSPNLNFKMGTALNASLMPLLDGRDRSTVKIGMDFSGRSNIIVKNFQITNYGYGVNTGNASYLTLDNIITMYTGDIVDSYAGRGIQFGSFGTYSSNYNTISNCIVVNSAAEGLSINGSNNTVTNCKVYCNEGVQGSGNNAATDYYIIVCGNNNKLDGCYAERIGDLAHYGHGIGLKANCQNNLVVNCTAVNMSEDFYVRHRGVKNNTFRNCTCIRGYGLVVRDGASNNIFEECVVDSVEGGLRFLDTSEDGGAQYAGRGNLFRNNIIKNADYGIYFDSYDQVSLVDSNTIVNCVFDKIGYLFRCDKESKSISFTNTIVTNVKTFTSGKYSLSCDFRYNNFYNNSFSMPVGTGNISSNPLYIDALNQNFRLQLTSPCKDVGVTLSYNQNDFDGITRPQGAKYDIGPFEIVQSPNASLSATISTLNVTCYNGNDGKATITASGGKTPYTYLWNTGATTATATGLVAGTYSVTVTDFVLTKKQYTITVSQPNALLGQIKSQTNVSCNGLSNGKAEVSTSGGVAAYTYLWTPTNQTNPIATGLAAGTYSVIITDANKCVAKQTLSITQPNALLNKVVLQTNVTCNGLNNGKAETSTSGGTGAYSYVWSPTGQTNAIATGLSAGSYSITVTDLNGCKAKNTVLVSQPEVLRINNTIIKNASTPTSKDGGITVEVLGGTSGYSYKWNTSPVQTSNIAVGLAAGTYSVIITDANGCTTTGVGIVKNNVVTSTSTYDDSNGFKYYPNPSNGILNIETNHTIKSVKVSNLLGEQVYFIDNIDKNNLTVNFTDQVSNGIYLLTVTTIDGGIVNEKIMVER